MSQRYRNSRIVAALAAVILFSVLPVHAQTANGALVQEEAEERPVTAPASAGEPASASVDELQRQLEAQQRINAQLRQRVITLEETVQRLRAADDATVAGPSAEPPRGQTPRTARRGPPEDGLEEGDLDALQQALVQRGSSVLSPWTAQIIPGVSWNHSGSSLAGSESDSYVADLTARMGLPMGAMVGFRVPYIVHAENPNGDNNGVGDISVSFFKELVARDRNHPSLLARIRYGIPTGADPFEIDVPLGSGFHSVSAALSSVQAVDPLVFYGEVSYSHSFSRTIGGSDLQPGDTINVGVGSTLAATPDIALSLGMNVAFVDNYEADGISIHGTDRTIGTVNLGAGFIINRDAYLSLSGRVGATDDAPDLGLGAALSLEF